MTENVTVYMSWLKIKNVTCDVNEIGFRAVYNVKDTSELIENVILTIKVRLVLDGNRDQDCLKVLSNFSANEVSPLLTTWVY